MTPKEKAIELVDRFKIYCDIDDPNGVFDWECCLQYNAKKCALITIDELLFESSFEVPNIRQRYWQEVKEEINKL